MSGGGEEGCIPFYFLHFFYNTVKWSVLIKTAWVMAFALQISWKLNANYRTKVITSAR